MSSSILRPERRLRFRLAAALVVLICPPVAVPASADSLARALSLLVAEYGRDSPAVLGVSVRRVATGEIRFQQRADEPLAPASCQKLLTAAVALERLGEGFSFVTSVYLSGGDVVIVGDFDPTLGDPYLAEHGGAGIYDELDRWARAVRRNIAADAVGSLLLVADRPTSAYRHPDWPKRQFQRWYCAPVAELNFHNNCLGVRFAVKDRTVSAFVEPSSSFIRIDNRVRVAKRHLWSMTAAEDLSVVRLTGSASRSSTEPLSVAIDDPVMLAGRVFADRLAAAGVRVAGGIRRVGGGDVDLGAARPVCRTATPIAAVLQRAMKRSLNMAAECLFLRAGDGTWAGSARVASDVLRGRYGLVPAGFTIRDGGGLSRKNRLSASGLTKLLVAAARRSDARLLLDALARSGVDGTMERRLTDAPYRGRVLAKTGSLAGISSLAGYVLDSKGAAAVAYAVFVNRIPARGTRRARALQDAICRAIVDSLNEPNRNQPARRR